MSTRRKPKVCILQYNASKYLTRVDRAARSLSGDGWDVVLIALKDADTPAIEQREGYLVKRIELRSRRLPRRFGLKFLRFAEGVWRTFMAAWKEDADVYDARDAYPLLAAHAAALLRRAQVVYDSDELALDRNWRVASMRVWRAAMRWYEGGLARRSAAVITSDVGRADVLEERYSIPRPTVVLNVPEVMERVAPDEEFRARALRDKRYLIIYQGVLIPNRGLIESVDAMRELPECRLALVGYGAMEEELREHIRSRGMEGSAEVFDAVPFRVMMGYVAAADIGLVPIVGSCLSYVTAAPNKLFECMMAGTPVVASNLPDMARVVTEERVGALVEDPTDPGSIAGAVRELLDGPEPLTEIGVRARAAAMRRYNWEMEEPVLLGVFDRLRPEAARR